MEMIVTRAGFLTSVQDLGRTGFREFGVSTSGALDPFGMRVANLLVGNDEGAAGLEITLGGLQLRLNDERIVACASARRIRPGPPERGERRRAPRLLAGAGPPPRASSPAGRSAGRGTWHTSRRAVVLSNHSIRHPGRRWNGPAALEGGLIFWHSRVVRLSTRGNHDGTRDVE